MVTYTVDGHHIDAIRAELDAASYALKAFPKGAMGLTPDSVKQSPEWKTAKHRYLVAFEMLRAFNEAKRRFSGKTGRTDR